MAAQCRGAYERYRMTEVDSMPHRLAAIQARIKAACERGARPPESVALLPVSKTFPVEAIRHAAALGLRRFGENKTQEIRHKAPELADLDLQWVMIGHLQTNKAKDVARDVAEVQSLDRLELADALQRRHGNGGALARRAGAGEDLARTQHMDWRPNCCLASCAPWSATSRPCACRA